VKFDKSECDTQVFTIGSGTDKGAMPAASK
jgi:hypothetical protein